MKLNKNKHTNTRAGSIQRTFLSVTDRNYFLSGFAQG